ncbi:MAG: PA0069 family radical SAM protein [Planctomycetales bacterium]|nr:PA0069 family radical SAM protein [Planctomycetales bacterium]
MQRRGSHIDPPNRFAAQRCEDDFAHFEGHDDPPDAAPPPVVDYLPDASQSIVSENDSPDVPFRYSVNPYRGCSHGCSYCYARNTHEYLGLSAGLDFETKILVKRDAPRLLREFLARPGWQGEPLTFSGATDCYQPAEREFRLTRACLEVALAAGQPVSLITKNALITRDLDLLQPMAERQLAHVFVSINSLDAELVRVMEPRTSAAAARLRAVEAIAAAGVPTGVMAAPVIPGLNDSELPAVLRAAADAGAQSASFTPLRLPLTVQPVFLEWLERTQTLRKEKIEARIRATHGGRLNEAAFGARMRGSGALAEQIRRTFQVFAQRYGLDRPLPPLDSSQFVPPLPTSGQLRLF